MIEGNGFSDISYEGGKYILEVDSWFDFSDLFLDVHSDYNSIGRDLAKRILSDEDYWEPYNSYDLVYDWVDQVWSMVADNKELYNHVVEWIGDNLVGDEIRSFPWEGTILTKEYLLEWSADSDVLGELIDELDVFEDLELELTWSYGSAYNTVVRDNIYNSVIGVIKDDFGKGEWESNTVNINGEDKTRHQLRFDVTGLLEESVTEYISDCWSNCRRYWDPKVQIGYLEGQSEEEGFEEYCDECRDTPFNEFSTFLYFYKEYLDDSDGLYHPSYDTHPNNEPLTKYFIEDVYNRI
jgi:hypothetical protein